MNLSSRDILRPAAGFLATLVLLFFLFQLARDRRVAPLPVYHTVGRFSLTNQNDQTVSLDALAGKVWVGNIVFSRCAGPCPRLTRQMAEIQAAIPASAPVRFVTLTADPVFDTTTVLRKYAERFHADDRRWFFLTGRKTDVYELAINQLKFTVLDNESDRKSDELFIHSSKFVLVDRQGRVRGYVEGDEPDTVRQVKRSINALLREEKQ
jgi:protein SCO1/2